MLGIAHDKDVWYILDELSFTSAKAKCSMVVAWISWVDRLGCKPSKTDLITNDCYLIWRQNNGGRLLVNKTLIVLVYRNYVEHFWLLILSMSRRANTNVRDILSICNLPWHSMQAGQKIFPNEVETIACCHWTKFIVFDKSSIPTYWHNFWNL